MTPRSTNLNATTAGDDPWEPFGVGSVRGMGVMGISGGPRSPGGELTVGTGFDTMFPDLFRAAYGVAYRLLGSREDAADCAQEACARACADWPKLPAPGVRRRGSCG